MQVSKELLTQDSGLCVPCSLVSLPLFLVQSSNATALLVSSFLSKGLISLSPALVIMLGADLGTALIARVLTLDTSIIQPVFLLTGSFFYLYSKKTLSGRIGFILIGLGLILLSLSLIMEAARPVLENEATKTILQTVNGILPAAFIFGAVLAIICYSSLAAVILTVEYCARRSEESEHDLVFQCSICT
ncbi:Na/Pi symporter [Anaerobiospirillum thomasii]|uniref:Na/Pi symporter n=1 Tax=Anaerobiospirillum thomasii TaxID=179995 RepID=UPI000DE57E1F|nr:Na/Pi symporter [Anaerobiospirillum thomasii]